MIFFFPVFIELVLAYATLQNERAWANSALDVDTDWELKRTITYYFRTYWCNRLIEKS